ncbi:MAG: GTPase ObgE, partial [Ignavibacteriae bacterium]|nr:GTPase ObgE [Ignavibacteriota bacterium]
GKGLGHEFLKHIERTEILLILIDATSENIKKDYEVLLNELNNYSKILFNKKKMIGISKIDLLSADELKKMKKDLAKKFTEEIFYFSAVAKINITELIDKLWANLNR